MTKNKKNSLNLKRNNFIFTFYKLLCNLAILNLIIFIMAIKKILSKHLFKQFNNS